MADKEDQKKSTKDRDKILDRKYKEYRIPRTSGGESSSTAPSSGFSSPTSPPPQPTSPFYQVKSRRSGEKCVEFDEEEKASYAPLTPDKKDTKGGLFSRIKKRFSLDKAKEAMAKDGEEEEIDVGYVNQWEEEEDEEEEEEESTSKEGGASAAEGGDNFAQSFKGLDFGKDELTKD